LNDIGVWAAFAAGILAFFSPCVLPLLPVYVSVLAGSADENYIKNGRSYIGSRKKRSVLFINTVFFILGFSAVFILLGVSVTALSRYLLFNRLWLTKIAGAFVVFFGLFLLGAFNLPFLLKERRSEMHFEKVTPLSAFLLGNAFSLGWTPCIGPVLSSVLFMAGSTQNYLAGFWLLLVFSTGLAMPFLILALAADRAMGFLKVSQKYLPHLQKAAGVVLIIMGVLLYLNRLK
jgi:cytochrome c-type biogenesis protein